MISTLMLDRKLYKFARILTCKSLSMMYFLVNYSHGDELIILNKLQHEEHHERLLEGTT